MKNVSEIDEKQEMLKFKVGTNWTGNNISTLLSWISISAYNIECLELAIDESRAVLRRNTIFALFVSTLAGTLNITQFNLIPQEYINITIKIILSILAFSVAINAGRIKIYQYQESLEDYIKIKQEWISFVVQISTELQLPIHLRRDALYLIECYKDKYLDLLKFECEISSEIKTKIKNKMEKDIKEGLKIKQSNLHPALMSKSGIKISEIVFDIAKIEGLNLLIAERDKSYKPNKEINEIYDKITTKVVLNKNKRMIDVSTYIEDKYFSNISTQTYCQKRLSKNGIQMEILSENIVTDISDTSEESIEIQKPNRQRHVVMSSRPESSLGDDSKIKEPLPSILKGDPVSHSSPTSNSYHESGSVENIIIDNLKNAIEQSASPKYEIVYAKDEDESIKDKVIDEVYRKQTPPMKRKSTRINLGSSLGSVLSKIKTKNINTESDDDLEMGCRVKTLDDN